MSKCYVCRGEYDVRFLDTPCPSCGNMYGVTEPEASIIGNLTPKS